MVLLCWVLQSSHLKSTDTTLSWAGRPLWNICVTIDHEFSPIAISTFTFLSLLINLIVIWISLTLSNITLALVEKELLTCLCCSIYSFLCIVLCTCLSFRLRSYCSTMACQFLLEVCHLFVLFDLSPFHYSYFDFQVL